MATKDHRCLLDDLDVNDRVFVSLGSECLEGEYQTLKKKRFADGSSQWQLVLARRNRRGKARLFYIPTREIEFMEVIS